MSPARIGYWVIALAKNLVSVRGGTAFLSAFGALWLIVEIANYYELFATQRLQALWPLFLCLGIALAVWSCRPATSVKCHLAGRDVAIEILVGDFFRQPGDFVVGTNTTFDTRIAPNLISEQSLQGQFTRRYYPSDCEFDAAIEHALSGIPFDQLIGSRIGKSRDFPIGTTVRVGVREGKAARSAYLVAMARINEHGSAKTTSEDLREAMGCLWAYISERATKGALVVPVLGSRFGRLPQREEIVQEMIKSFVAACAEGNFCEKLTIALHPQDVVDNNIDLQALGDYLRHTCKYALKAPHASQSFGTPVGNTSEAVTTRSLAK